MDVYGLRLSKRAMSGRDTAWGYPSRDCIFYERKSQEFTPRCEKG